MPDITTGVLPLGVLAAAIVCAPICGILLWKYRRAVSNGMAAFAGAADIPSSRSALHPPGSTQLHIQNLDPAQALDGTSVAMLHRATWRPWLLAVVYVIAGLIYAAVITTAGTVANALTGGWWQFVAQAWVFLWPAIAAALIVVPLDRARRGFLPGVYFAVLVGIGLVVGARNPALGPLAIPGLWLLLDGPPSVLVLAFLWRPIRAVGPIVMALLTVASIGAQSLLLVWVWSPSFQAAVVRVGDALGMSGVAVFSGLIAGGLLIFVAALGWPILRSIGRSYVAKRFSERELTIDAVFLMFTFYHVIVYLSGTTWIWALTGVLAFSGYKAAARLGFRVATSEVTPAPKLLLLRVFRLAKKSEQLFERLRRHWLTVGSVRMIAGPDLATATIEPHEFLEFISGRLAAMFVVSAADLERRLAELDDAPDPDGCHRVNEFFCRGDTWKMTMRALAASSDTVLMDLRSFSESSSGCIYEIGSLLDSIDLRRVVFVVDGTTDEGFLEATLHKLWRSTSSVSPNRRPGIATARLLRIDRHSEHDVLNLLRCLVSVPEVPVGL